MTHFAVAGGNVQAQPSTMANVQMNMLPSIPNSAPYMLSSMPNSAQMVSIANAALQNIMNGAPTPLPPPLGMFAGSSLDSTANLRITSGGTGHAGMTSNTGSLFPPDLLPTIPYPSIAGSMPTAGMAGAPKLGAGQPTMRLKKRLPTRSLSEATEAGGRITLNISPAPIGGADSVPMFHQTTAFRNAQQAQQAGMAQTQASALLSLEKTKNDLISAIRIERGNHEFTRQRLHQIHKHYNEMVAKLKKEANRVGQKLAVINKTPTNEEVEAVELEKEELNEVFARKQEERLNFEHQLKQKSQENQKLSIIIHCQNRQLALLLSQYQGLCATEQKKDESKKGRSDAERIVKNLDTLDIIDADTMVHQAHQSAIQTPGNDAIAQQVQNNPWFAKIIDENRMLERHIRFLRHIIERETQRCTFKELITGKQLMPANSTQNQDTEGEIGARNTTNAPIV